MCCFCNKNSSISYREFDRNRVTSIDQYPYYDNYYQNGWGQECGKRSGSCDYGCHHKCPFKEQKECYKEEVCKCKPSGCFRVKFDGIIKFY